ncbi:xanthine phosphoribosyltransferase [Alicyclobacillus fodiniaquatilis]|uniref:Xanthine phosphoribosyltransferase n=1 Tax=Alicyclobacillus fodiniaquatilis TaxID=1661150 RepID=A0ABW4JLD2_9BACL
MQRLRQRICEQGLVLSDRVLKVDSFLNHQVDPALISEIGKTMAERYRHEGITKVMTIEASGIHIAFAVASVLGVPFVYGKKKKATTQSDELYRRSVYSYTRQETYEITVSKPFLSVADTVLIVDDILAEGAALNGLIGIVHDAGARLAGVSVVIEKSFQSGRKTLDDAGIPVYALARISKMSPETGVEFVHENDEEAVVR